VDPAKREDLELEEMYSLTGSTLTRMVSGYWVRKRE
jgi:hypothetical protein